MEGKSQKKGQRGLQLLSSKGHRGMKGGEFAANPQHLSTQAWKGGYLASWRGMMATAAVATVATIEYCRGHIHR